LIRNNMGKRKVITKSASGAKGKMARASAKTSKKRASSATLYINSTYNNTMLLLADTSGNAMAWSSSGSLGFKGARKGTPFAASKIGEVLAEKAEQIGVKEVDIVIKGVGSGRESAMRSFVAKGIIIKSISDRTPIAHNGPRPRKVRRV